MDINISVPACLDFLRRKKEFLVQLLVELVEYEASLRGDKCGIRIGVLLVPHVHDRLALFVYFIHHADEILLVIPVIPVALGHYRFYPFQRVLDNIMHYGNGNPFFTHFIHLVDYGHADPALLLVRELGKCTVCGFSDGHNDFLYIEILRATVFLDDLYLFFGLVKFSIIFHIDTSCFYYFSSLICLIMIYMIRPPLHRGMRLLTDVI